MKTKIITSQQVEAPEIDWSKPALYKSKHTDHLILSTGSHTKNTFSGLGIHNEYPLSFSDHWLKDCFTLVTEPTIIEFNSKD